MHSTDDQRVEPFWKRLGKTKPDTAAHRVAQVVRLVDTFRVEHGNHVGSHDLPIINVGIVWLVALAVTTGVDHYELVVTFEDIDITAHAPTSQIARKPVLKHEWLPIPFHLVVNLDTIVVCVWHVTPHMH